MNLSTSLFLVPGVGPTFAKKLTSLNLYTVEDLINHFPFRYDDFSTVTNTLEAQEGEKVTIQGEIWSIKNIFTRSKKVLTQALLNDGNAPIELVWFNQSWLTKQIQPGDRLQVSGKVSKYKNKISIMAPVWEKIPNEGLVAASKQALHTGRLVPVYPETFGLTSKWLRAKIDQILPRVGSEVIDPLPEDIKGTMLPLLDAIKKIHFPDSMEDVMRAQERLGFDELFYIQLATQKTRADWKEKPSIDPYTINEEDLQKFFTNLPFQLTNAQLKVIADIAEDLKKTQPMNRLVQGEVGSGKTVVAAAIIYISFMNGFRTLYMAPTEILAFQHFATLTRILEPFHIKVGIYTGSKKKIEEADVLVGTHALLSEKVYPENVGLVIVDEQQRFGVEQRTLLRSKAKVPHFLTMTATPIPRTVALTLYGDLDLSVIDELPKGRKEIKTHVVPAKKRADAYEFMRQKIQEGDQVYIITPLIELSETLTSIKAATVEFEKLKREIFPDLRLGLLHGRLKPKEKEAVINQFKEKEIDILVSTSVVEVGVDVPNATIMAIEGAERFGLAQLHQLRGRVGRGEKESFCLLFPTQEDNQTVSRLKNLEKTNNGLELAELDLKIRGSGELFGKRQSGRFELKIASFSDLTLIEKTRDAARALLQKDPKLDRHQAIKAKLASLSPGVMPD